MARTHYYPEDRVHYVWDNEQDPVLTVEPGDTVVYRTREVSDGQIGPDSDASALASLDRDRLYLQRLRATTYGARNGPTR